MYPVTNKNITDVQKFTKLPLKLYLLSSRRNFYFNESAICSLAMEIKVEAVLNILSPASVLPTLYYVQF